MADSNALGLLAHLQRRFGKSSTYRLIFKFLNQVQATTRAEPSVKRNIHFVSLAPQTLSFRPVSTEHYYFFLFSCQCIGVGMVHYILHLLSI